MNTRASPTAVTASSVHGVTRAQFVGLFTAVMLPMFLASVDQTLLATASLSIGTEFQALDDTAWLALGYLMASAVMIPLYGRLGDRYGYRRMLIIALSVFAAGSAWGGLAQSMGGVVAARVLQGLGGGGLMVLSQALIGSIVPPRERPRYQGWFAAVFTVASVSGPVIGGFIVHGLGWRWLFWGMLPVVALAVWRVSGLPQSMAPTDRRASFTDVLGVAGFALASVITLLWVSFAGQRFAFASITSVALILTAVVCWWALIRRERQHPAAFLPIEVLRLPGVAAISATIVVFASAMFALVFFVPIYLQLVQGHTASLAGLQLLPLTLGMAIGSVSTSRIVAHTRRAGVLPRYGLSLAAVAVLALAVAPTEAWVLTSVMVLCGLGFGTVMPNAQLIVQTQAGRARLGAASALVSLARSAGANLGTAVFGALVFTQLRWLTGGEPLQAWLARHASESGRIETAFHISFAGLAALLLMGAWIASRIPVLPLDEPSGDAAPQ